MWLKWGRSDGNLRDLIYSLSWREEIRSHSASHPEVNLWTGTCWKSWLRLGPHSLHIHAQLCPVFRLVLLLYLVWCCWGALIRQESWQRFQCCRVCRWIYRLVYQKDLNSLVNTEQNWSLRAFALSVGKVARLPSPFFRVDTPKTSCFVVLIKFQKGLVLFSFRLPPTVSLI